MGSGGLYERSVVSIRSVPRSQHTDYQMPCTTQSLVHPRHSNDHGLHVMRPTQPHEHRVERRSSARAHHLWCIARAFLGKRDARCSICASEIIARPVPFEYRLKTYDTYDACIGCFGSILYFNDLDGSEVF